MAIILPHNLPAAATLRREGVDVFDTGSFNGHGQSPLRIAVLNLMPCKPTTETQIARRLGDTDHAVDLTLFIPDSHQPKTTASSHIDHFYKRWSDLRHRRFDGLIITGAPVETLPFEAVSYWREITEIFDWAQRNVLRRYYICWAAQAALYHFHGVKKHTLPSKRFGVYEQQIRFPDHPLFDGLEGTIQTPVSRHSENRAADLPPNAGVSVLADSADAGLSLLEDRPRQTVLMFNHLEYDPETLPAEYERDRSAGKAITLPVNAFPGDDPAQQPTAPWRQPARRFFANWLSDIRTASEAADWNRFLRIQPAARPVLPAVRPATPGAVAEPLCG